MTTKVRNQIAQIIFIIARIVFQDDPRKVIYIVRSSSDATVQYQVHMFDGKACSCTCPSRKPCKHMSRCEAQEQERTRKQQIEAEIARIDAEIQAYIADEVARVSSVQKSEDESSSTGLEAYYEAFDGYDEAYKQYKAQRGILSRTEYEIEFGIYA
jgi:hypothetical protein